MSRRAESSLKAFDRLADRLRLHRQADPRAILVVEGRSDKRLLSDLAMGQAVVFDAGTRSLALDAVTAAAAFPLPRVIGVLDRDFDSVVADAEEMGLAVVAYEGADLEDMLISQPGARRCIAELGSTDKLAEWGGEAALLEHARGAVREVARLRRGNVVHGWGIVFDAVDLDSKIDKDALVLRLSPYCAALAQTVDHEPNQAELERLARTSEDPRSPLDGSVIVRGRDTLAVVSVALRRRVGTRTKDQVRPDFLCSVLRASADLGRLRASSWFERVATLGQFAVPQPST